MAADTAPASRLAANDMEPPEASHYERLKLTAPGPAAPPPLEVDGDLGLVVDRVGKSFGGRQVVKDVSLTLRRGEVAGLLGPNGAGKTTCFYMITGLIAADYGAIYLDGEDITALPMYQRARAGLGYLPQETSIFRGMTVEQNVLAVVELREKRRREARDIATRSWRSCTSPTCATRRPCRSPAASGDGWRSPARWPPTRPSCCSTSRSPASTRWRSPTSAR